MRIKLKNSITVLKRNIFNIAMSIALFSIVLVISFGIISDKNTISSNATTVYGTIAAGESPDFNYSYVWEPTTHSLTLTGAGGITGFGVFNSIADELGVDVSYFKNVTIGGVDSSHMLKFKYRTFSRLNLSLPYVETLKFVDFDATIVETISGSFREMSNLVELDLSGFNVSSSLTSINSLCYGCPKLKKVILPDLSSTVVTDISKMFQGNSSLEEVDLSTIDTTNIGSFNQMFQNCLSLRKLDISNFKIKDGATLQQFASNTPMLEEFIVGPYCSFVNEPSTTKEYFRYDAGRGKPLKIIFKNDTTLSAAEQTNYDANKNYLMNTYNFGHDQKTPYFFNLEDSTYTDGYGIHYFDEGDELSSPSKTIITHHYDLSAAGDNSVYADLYFDGTLMFSGNGSTTKKFSYDESNPTNNVYPDWYNERESIKKVRFKGNFKIGNYTSSPKETNLDFYFLNCTNLTDVDLTGLKLYKDDDMLCSMKGMFFGCTSLKNIDFTKLPSTDFWNVKNMSYMFYGCTSLEEFSLGQAGELTSCGSFDGMFDGCTNLKYVDFSNVEFQVIGANANKLFKECTSLDLIDFSNSNFNITSGQSTDTFLNCKLLREIKLGTVSLNVAPPSQDVLGTAPGELTLVRCYDDINTSYKWYLKNSNNLIYNSPISNIPGADVNTSSIVRDLDNLIESYDVSYEENGSVILKAFSSSETIDEVAYDAANIVIDGYTDKYGLPLGTLKKGNDLGFTEDTSYVKDTVNAKSIVNSGTYYKIRKIVFNGYVLFNSDCSHYFNNNSFLHLVDLTNAYTNLNTVNYNSMFYNDVQLEKVIMGTYNFKTKANWKYSMYSIFMNCSRLKELDLSGCDFSNCDSMQNAFYYNMSLTDLSLPATCNFNFNLTFENAFYQCFGISTLDLSGWNLSKAKSFKNTFQYCTALTSITLPASLNFNSSDVSFYGMFDKCSNLASVNISGWNLNNVSDFAHMFEDCSKLSSVSFPSTYYANCKPTNANCMFNNCSELLSVDLSCANFSETLDFKDMFNGCTNITEITFVPETNTTDYFDASSATTFESMFEGCNALSSLNIGKGIKTTSSLTTCFKMFKECNALTSIDFGDSFNVSGVTTFYEMFYNCLALTNVSFIPALDTTSYFDASSATTFESMFNLCKALETVNIGKGIKTTTALVSLKCMFRECNKLLSIDFGNMFVTSNVTTFEEMFYSCKKIASISFVPASDTTNYFDASSATTFAGMFNTCHLLDTLNIGKGIKTSIALTTCSRMFKECNTLTSLDFGDSFVTSKISDFEETFYNCNSLTTLTFVPVSNILDYFDASSVKYFRNTFCKCSALTTLNIGKGIKTTSTLKYVNHMFDEVNLLPKFDLGDQFVTSGVQEFGSMFATTSNVDSPTTEITLCPSGQYLDMSNAQTTNAMFKGRNNLTTLNVGKGFKTTNKLTNIGDMFAGLSSIENILIGDEFDTSGVTNGSSLFNGDSSLRLVDMGDKFTAALFVSSGLTNMFQNCTSLTSFDLGSSFSNTGVKNVWAMLWDLPSLTKLDLSRFSYTNESSTAPGNFTYNLNSVNSIKLGPEFTRNIDTNRIFKNSDSTNIIPTSLEFASGTDASVMEFYVTSYDWESDNRVIFNPSDSLMTDANLSMGNTPVVISTLTAPSVYVTYNDETLDPLTYTWQKKNSDSTYSNVTGQNTNELTLVPNAENVGTYRCVIDNGYLSFTSKDINLSLTDFVVTYDYNGADGGNTDTSKVLANTLGITYGALPTPTKLGYTFGGWFTDSSLSDASLITSESVVTNRVNHTIYAKWLTNDLVDATITGITNLIYNENEQKDFEVWFGDNKLTLNTDYTVTYNSADYVSAGEKSITITAASGSNYLGSKTFTYNIAKKELTFNLTSSSIEKTYDKTYDHSPTTIYAYVRHDVDPTNYDAIYLDYDTVYDASTLCTAGNNKNITLTITDEQIASQMENSYNSAFKDTYLNYDFKVKVDGALQDDYHELHGTHAVIKKRTLRLEFNNPLSSDWNFEDNSKNSNNKLIFKEYDGSDEISINLRFASNNVNTCPLDGDDINILSPAILKFDSANANQDSNKRLLSHDAFTVYGQDASNYQLFDPNTQMYGFIDPKKVTIDTSDLFTKIYEKTYDGNTLSSGDVTIEDTIDGYTYTLVYSKAYNDKNAGLNKDITYTLKSINIVNSENENELRSNFDITLKIGDNTQAVLNSNLDEFTLSNGQINRVKLSYSINGKDKTYDGNSSCHLTINNVLGIVGTEIVNVTQDIYGKYYDKTLDVETYAKGTHNIKLNLGESINLLGDASVIQNYEIDQIDESTLEGTIADKAIDISMLSPISDLTYDGTYQVPSITLYDALNSYTLMKDTDYELIIPDSDNKDAKSSINLTIKGKGNYGGQINTTFNINKFDITNSSLVLMKTYSESNPITKEYDPLDKNNVTLPSSVLSSLTLYYPFDSTEDSSDTDVLFNYTSISYDSAVPDNINLKDINVLGLVLDDAFNNNFNYLGNTSKVFDDYGKITDTVCPTISSIDILGSKVYGLGQNIDFVFNISEDIIVDPSATLKLYLIGPLDSLNTTNAFGEGQLINKTDNSLTFRYTVDNNAPNVNGVLGLMLDITGGTAHDIAGNTLDITIPGIDSIKIDTIGFSIPGSINPNTLVTDSNVITFTYDFSTLDMFSSYVNSDYENSVKVYNGDTLITPDSITYNDSDKKLIITVDTSSFITNSNRSGITLKAVIEDDTLKLNNGNKNIESILSINVIRNLNDSDIIIKVNNNNAVPHDGNKVKVKPNSKFNITIPDGTTISYKNKNDLSTLLHELEMNITDNTLEFKDFTLSKEGWADSIPFDITFEIEKEEPKNDPEEKPKDTGRTITVQIVPSIINKNASGYIKGYLDNTFRGNNFITRAETTAILSRIDSAFNEINNYKDQAKIYIDNKPFEWYENYIGYVTKNKLMIGYGNKIFKPDNNMTRAEFATAIRRLLDLKDVMHSYKIFNDTSNRWFEKDVDTLAIYGYISGYEDNSFKGDNYITRGEVVTIINKVLGKELSDEQLKNSHIEEIFKDVSKDDWFYKELVKAYYGK